jgi:hypothetical protein
MWKGIQSFRGWGKKFGTVLTREASAARRLPVRHFTFVAGSSRARSSSYREHFVNAAEPAWNVPCPWHGHSCRGSLRQRDATSPRIRDVPPPCCVRLSWCFLIASRRMSATEHVVPLRSIHNPAMGVEQRKVVKGTLSCCRCYGTFRLNVKLRQVRRREGRYLLRTNLCGRELECARGFAPARRVPGPAAEA